MKFGITRWKTVPSYSRSVLRCRSRGSVHSRAPVARSTKLATVFGACSGNRRALNVPMDVTNVAVGTWGVLLHMGSPVYGTPPSSFASRHEGRGTMGRSFGPGTPG